jgi:hypothetical protein
LSTNIEDVLKGLYALYMYPARFPTKIFDVFFSAIDLKGPLFDPFAGSGSLALASYFKGFDSIVWDLNPMIYVLVDAGLKLIGGYDLRKVLGRIEEAMSYGKPYLPNGAEYWWCQEGLDLIGRIWGFFRDNLALFNPTTKEFEPYEDSWSLYAVVALYSSRKLSYADDNVPKWYKSKLKIDKIMKKFLGNDVRDLFKHYVVKKVKALYQAQEKVTRPSHEKEPTIVVKAVDAVTTHDYPEKVVGVLTSPPYIQAQEYIRSFSWELRLLGVSETMVSELRRLEIPYRPPAELKIESPTYYEVLDAIEEPKLKRLVESYFTNTLMVLEKACKSIEGGGIMGIFVGEATVRGKAVPIVKIIKEHLTSELQMTEISGMEVEDKIKRRRLFKKRKNSNPNGIEIEHLVFLRKD